MNEKSPLPEFLTPFFWEYGDQSLSWANDRELIIRRILRNGNWRAVRWLWKKMGDEGLRNKKTITDWTKRLPKTV